MSTLIIMAADTGKKPVCDTNTLDIFLQDVVEAQTDIGWNLLQFSFVAAVWGHTQQQWVMHIRITIKNAAYNGRNSYKSHFGNTLQCCGTAATKQSTEKISKKS